nr:hypothetical protein [Tanacetum cinerariifolium]
MSDNIPFEIQTEIIKRIDDVKSLIRFRSVSKPWKSFVDTSEFIAGYRARKTSLLLRYIDNDDMVKYVSLNNDTLTKQQDLAPRVSAFMKQFSYTVIVGSSHGLLCLYAFNKDGVAPSVEPFY